jgi:hypothetical protein
MSIQESAANQRFGWHWAWYLPISVLVLLLVERHTVIYAIEVAKMTYRRWDWGALISPSAAICDAVVATSVALPILGILLIPSLVKTKRSGSAALLLIAIFLLPFVTDTLIWGSFPFIIDDDGISRLRMIPFIPWPSGNYGEL